MKHRPLKAAFSLVIISFALAGAQDIASFEKRITVKKLPNGLTIVICERSEAPVFPAGVGAAEGAGAESPAPGFASSAGRSAPAAAAD